MKKSPLIVGICLVFIFFAPHANAAIMLVQTSTAAVYSGTSLNDTLSNNVTNGDVLVAMWNASFSSITAASATCTTGNWTVKNFSNGMARNVATSYAVITSSGSCTVHSSVDADTGGFLVDVHELSGVNTSTPLDTASTWQDTNYDSNPFSSGTSTTSVNGDYILGFTSNGNGADTNSGAGFTFRIYNDGGGTTEDMVQSAAGPISASFTPTGNGTFSAVMMAFRPSSSSGSTTSTLSLTNSGGGSVTSNPAGINCGSSCSMVVNNGTQVTLTATPNSGYTTAWSNCGGTTSGNTCTTTVNANTTIGVTFTPPDTTPPSIPTNLQATAISSSQINLSWTASTDNVGVTGYKVYRGGSQIGTSPSTSYTDTGLTPSTLYTYTVSAYDAAGNTSNQSSPASATTQAQGGGGGSGSWSSILSPSRAINWGNAGLPATFPDGETTPNPWTPPTRTQCGSPATFSCMTEDPTFERFSSFLSRATSDLLR